MHQIQQQQIKFIPYGLFEINLGLFSMVRKIKKILFYISRIFTDFWCYHHLHSNTNSI